MSVSIENSEVAILSRVIRPHNGTWSKSAAQSILKFDFASVDVRRMNTLGAKARQGSLSPAQETELENYRDVGRLLELLQSKARLSLRRLATAH
jgi:predicted metal-dependent hydrolase